VFWCSVWNTPSALDSESQGTAYDIFLGILGAKEKNVRNIIY
jgi:hypothetical protein